MHLKFMNMATLRMDATQLAPFLTPSVCNVAIPTMIFMNVVSVIWRMFRLALTPKPSTKIEMDMQPCGDQTI